MVKIKSQPKSLDQPLPGGQDGATVVVEPIEAGRLLCPPQMLHTSGGPLASLKMVGIGVPRSRWITVPCPAFLVRHPSYGAFVVDTGLHPSVGTKPAANLGRLLTRAAKPELASGEDLPAQLRARGVDPKSIPLVVMTHLHFDHASAMSEFEGAIFLMTDAEWEAATTDSRPFLRGYRPAHYDYAFEYRTVGFGERSVDSYATFGRSFDLFGDGSVRLVSTPGHTAGHQSVVCRLKDRELVIAGDAIYTLSQLADAPLPPRPVDMHTYRRSLQELRLFAEQFPDALIIPGHDIEVWPTLDKRYE